VAPQLKFRLQEEEAEIERVMLHENCNRGEAIRRLEKREAGKKSAPTAALCRKRTAGGKAYGFVFCSAATAASR